MSTSQILSELRHAMPSSPQHTRRTLGHLLEDGWSVVSIILDCEKGQPPLLVAVFRGGSTPLEAYEATGQLQLLPDDARGE